MLKILAFLAGKNLKPYQGLKLGAIVEYAQEVLRRKKPKTLSGIETLSLKKILAQSLAPEKT